MKISTAKWLVKYFVKIIYLFHNLWTCQKTIPLLGMPLVDMIEPVIYFLAVELFIWATTYLIIYVAFEIYEGYRCGNLIDSAKEIYLDGTPERIAWERMIWEHRKEISRVNNYTGKYGATVLAGVYLAYSLLRLVGWLTHS